MDLFGSQIQGDLIGAAQWRIYQGHAAADSAEAVSEETAPAPEGAEEEIVETELEVSGGTLEVTQLAAAQAVQAKAQESAAAAAEQVKAAKAAKDAAERPEAVHDPRIGSLEV